MVLVGGVDAQPSPGNPHEMEGSCDDQPQVKWRKERIRCAVGQNNAPSFGLADTAALRRTAPALALRARKNPTDKGWVLRYWWSRGGSNPWPSHCERDALPAELRPLSHGSHYTHSQQQNGRPICASYALVIPRLPSDFPPLSVVNC